MSTPERSKGVPAGAEDPRPIIDELLFEWPERSSVTSFHQPAARRGKKFTGGDAARITAVIGLTDYIYDTARAIVVLLDAGHVNASVPLVRLAYETALTAAWLVQSRDQHGITAFMQEYTRGRRALQKDAQLAFSEAFRDGAHKIVNADPSAYEEKVDSTKRFRQLCLDLKPGGVDAYILYRILSSYSHASADVSDLYFAEGGEPGGMPHRREAAHDALSPGILLFMTASSLVWAGRAFSYLTKDSQHRRSLRDAARRLEINPELQLSDVYHQRHARR